MALHVKHIEVHHIAGRMPSVPASSSSAISALSALWTPPQVDHQLVVKEHPHIIVAMERKARAGDIFEAGVDLYGEVIVVFVALVAEERAVNGEKPVGWSAVGGQGGVDDPIAFPVRLHGKGFGGGLVYAGGIVEKRVEGALGDAFAVERLPQRQLVHRLFVRAQVVWTRPELESIVPSKSTPSSLKSRTVTFRATGSDASAVQGSRERKSASAGSREIIAFS